MQELNRKSQTAQAGSAEPPAEVRIALPQQFTFDDHRRFRAGYFNGKAPAARYVVDFTVTRLIDSAGLGMLLQLTEYVLNDPSRVHLVNCTADMRQTLAMAGVAEAATIV